MDSAQAAQNALECVLEAKPNEKVTILCDDTHAEVGKAFEQGAKNLHADTTLVILKTSSTAYRQEIPPELTPHLTTERADIYINLLRGTREETPFRIKLIHSQTSDGKTRLGHCPGVTLDMLTDGALTLTAEEHRQMQRFAAHLMAKLKDAVKLEIRTPVGTHLTLSVKDRPFYTDTMLDWKLMKWMNLPTGEVIVAPVEDSLEGKLVCDLAIGGIGPVKTPVTLKVKGGKVDAVTCSDAEVLRRVQNSLHTDAMAKVVGEFAFGINPKARFVEEFLETEKMYGTIHIAFGDNTDMPGGQNNSANHMDLMMDKPTVTAQTAAGSKTRLLLDGAFQTPPEPDGEKLPISEVYTGLRSQTIFKTAGWWEAVVRFESPGKRQVGLYLWQKRGGAWKTQKTSSGSATPRNGAKSGPPWTTWQTNGSPNKRAAWKKELQIIFPLRALFLPELVCGLWDRRRSRLFCRFPGKTRVLFLQKLSVRLFCPLLPPSFCLCLAYFLHSTFSPLFRFKRNSRLERTALFFFVFFSVFY
jgi:leucyl aminopeptidase (aminopeptidase T)